MAKFTAAQTRVLRHLAAAPADHGRSVRQLPRGRINLGGLIVNFRTLLDLWSAGLVDWPGDSIKSPVWITDAGKVALGA